MSRILFSIYIFSLFIPLFFSLSCLSSDSTQNPWFFILKYPRKTQQISGQDNKHAYYDFSMSQSGHRSFLLRNRFIDDENEGLYNTLNQINNLNGVEVIAWNDEPPKAGSGYEEHTAHSKGLIAYDSQTDTGFYLVHSTPKYPDISDDGTINIQIPVAERKFGQNYLCMSGSGKELDSIAKGLSIIGSTIYYNSFKSENLPNLLHYSSNPKSSSSKKMSLTIPFSISGVSFTGFYKNPYYTSGFIFEDIMIPQLQDSLMVESWGRPYQSASCSTYNCLNIKEIQIKVDPLGHWTDMDDHSKWAISVNNGWICSGDMNRMTSQAKRGGAFFCLQDNGLWNILNNAIVKTDKCSGERFLQ